MYNFDADVVNQLGLKTYVGGGADSVNKGNKLGQDEFLKLLSTQLNNQDPTQPMDNGQFLAQIAQFASVTGIQDMQSSLKQLTDSLISNQTMQAASLVGHQVVAASSSAILGSNGVLSGAIDLNQSTNQLKVGIYDDAGQLVREMNLGAQGKGMLPFAWDGITEDGDLAPMGLYRIKAEANIGGTLQAMGTYVASNVDSVMVDTASQQVMLNISTGETIKIGDVKQIM